MKVVQEKEVAEVLRGIQIPPQPQIMVDLSMEMAMPNFALSDLADIIVKDVGLSGRLLKLVNSSFFGLSNKIASIHQATNLLGLSSVTNLINAISIQDAMPNDDVEFMSKFWDSAMDIASASAQVAKSLNFVASDEAFALGLFHNCAIPLLMQKFDNYPQVIRESYLAPAQNISITNHENEVLGTNHSVVGYFVAKAWKLPERLGVVISLHHNAGPIFAEHSYPDRDVKNLLAVLKIAEHLCGTHQILGHCDRDYEFELFSQDLYEYLGITQIEIDNMRDDLHDMGILS